MLHVVAAFFAGRGGGVVAWAGGVHRRDGANDGRPQQNQGHPRRQ